jgi:two-component system sensor histidine kinase HydH
VRLVVRDNGEGIAADAFPRIMEPFFTTKPTGTGLGLAIVKRVVEIHNGTLHIGSSPGEGCAVSIELPRSIAQAG